MFLDILTQIIIRHVLIACILYLIHIEYGPSFSALYLGRMGEVSMNYLKSEPHRQSSAAPPGYGVWSSDQECEDIGRSNDLSTYQRSFNTLDERRHPVEDASASPICPAPLCRQFWKAGDYTDTPSSKSRVQNSRSYMHVHPKFLHSNATSHKWAFGAIAELLDNAIDEIHNGSSFVSVDKITNPRDGSPSLLIQDDGSGMDPDAIRRCMSFGFSDKQSKSAIGKYGNGFKTSTMRLGADAIVFSRHEGNRTLTQSIGFLSYTYLSRTGLDRIVVPMVDYEYNMSTATFEPICQYGGDNFQSNIAIILGWSPYTTIAELMKQFDDIGTHGTKVIVFNLWFAEEAKLEFDFDTDPKDIRVDSSNDSQKTKSKTLISEQHIGNQYRFSLRVYMSILYLRIPQNFRIILRGVIVEHHIIARDLKFPEVIMYKPQTRGTKEGEVFTTIGFLKEAPNVYIHGFNVYHKNRLILPFWQVVSYASSSRGRGVVGVLEANFIEPTHNKQDFERTSLFQKLETRLKDMTWEYWDQHCGLIGYQVLKKARAPESSPSSSYVSQNNVTQEPVSKRTSTLGFGPAQPTDPVVSLPARPAIQDGQTSIQQHSTKRAPDDFLSGLGRGRKQARVGFNFNNAGQSREVQSVTLAAKRPSQQEAVALMQENEELLAKCFQHEKAQEELNHRISQLRKELEEVRHEYMRMLYDLKSIEVGADIRVFEGLL